MLQTEKNKYFLVKAKRRYGDDVDKLFDYSQVDYVKAKGSLTICCIKHDYIFKQRASTHLEGGIGCPICRHNKTPKTKIKTTDDLIKRAKEVHDNLDTYEKTHYTNSKTKIIVTCKIHGDYEISTGSYLFGGRCTKCGIENKYLPLDTLKKTIKEVHGDTYEYDWDTYKNSSSKMKIKCKIHGWFEQRVNTHISGRGCMPCSVISRTFTQEKAISIIRNNFRDRYTYDKLVYVNDASLVTVTCKKHGDFLKIPQELLRGNGCTKCKESKPERELANILEDADIEYIQEYKIPGYKYRYDCYIPSLGVIVELDGQQHSVAVEYLGGDAKLAYNKKLDKIKDELAKSSGIYMIRIPYTKFKVIEDTFYYYLSNMYPYRNGNKFYTNFVKLLVGLKLPTTTTKLDVVKYLTCKNK